jgi:hypothetical protein
MQCAPPQPIPEAECVPSMLCASMKHFQTDSPTCSQCALQAPHPGMAVRRPPCAVAAAHMQRGAQVLRRGHSSDSLRRGITRAARGSRRSCHWVSYAVIDSVNIRTGFGEVREHGGQAGPRVCSLGYAGRPLHNFRLCCMSSCLQRCAEPCAPYELQRMLAETPFGH